VLNFAISKGFTTVKLEFMFLWVVETLSVVDAY